MPITLDGTTGITTPGLTNTGTALAISSGGTGVTALPAFSAYSVSGTPMTNTTYVKVTFDTEKFDTNNNFASSTFTPTVAGYYQVNCNLVYLTTSTVVHVVLTLRKNGVAETYTNIITNLTSGSSMNLSYVIAMNGTTDYIEMFCYMQGTGTLSVQAGGQTTFNGSFLRSL